MFLPETFKPSENEVIVGRGKRIASHSGNKRFHQQIVKPFVEEYANADKRGKGDIITQIVATVRNNSSFGAGFVKQDGKNGSWSVVEDMTARIATAQSFRDQLSYKSSKHTKQQRRKTKREIMKKQKKQGSGGLPMMTPLPKALRMVSDCSSGDDSSTEQGYEKAYQAMPAPTAALSTDLFSSLYNAIEVNLEDTLTEDPFEPTPLAETDTVQPDMQSSSLAACSSNMMYFQNNGPFFPGFNNAAPLFWSEQGLDTIQPPPQQNMFGCFV